MRICVLATSYPRHSEDHASTFVHGLSKGIAQNGHHVTAIVPHEKGLTSQVEMDGVIVKRFHYLWPFQYEQVAYGYGIPENIKVKIWARIGLPFFVLAFFFKALFESKRCDIIHAHWEISAFVGYFVARIRRRPIVLTVHRLVTRSYFMRTLTRWLLKRMDFIYFNSTYTRDLARDLVEVLPPHEIIYPSVDLAFFSPGTPSSSFRDKFAIKHDDKVILGVGRLIEKKGFNYLIEAFAKLTSNGGANKNLRLIIAGGGPLAESLKAQAKEVCPENSFFFTDFVQPEEVRSLLREADVLVVPSFEDRRGEIETLGVVSMEAMACRVPVIASRIGGIPDVIENGVTGLLVEPKSPTSLTLALKEILDQPQKAEEFKTAALEKVQRVFSWDHAINRTLDSYGSLLWRRQ